ncbi:MAG TPA: hypothetical protein VFI61_00060 [Patescibacteria group bacterium]|nr:hypothetical protein [Patescibacteria group bacterium]
MKNLIAATNPFGTVKAPNGLGSNANDPAAGIGNLIQTIIWVLIIGASIYALINLILAGYAFMSAGEDSKKVAGAWAQIYQTIMGLAFAAGAFVLAAIFGQLIFGDATFILNPRIPTL